MKRITNQLSFAFQLLLCTIIVSCVNEQVVEQANTDEVSEQGFSGVTRTTTSGDPEHGDAYTLVSYKVEGMLSTDIDMYQIRDDQQYGYYAYDDGSDSDRAPGTLVPVEIKFPTYSDNSSPPYYTPLYGKSPLKTAWRQAQKLNSVPVTGMNTTTMQGVYRTAVIHPAVPMNDATAFNLGYLAVFELTDDVFASMPDDADGSGTPFEIVVKSNAQVHPLPDPTNLFPIKSAVKLWFYSEYYGATDVNQENPKEQLFSISSIKLYNLGSNGWYNARTGIIYPNYNYRNNSTDTDYRTVYSPDEVFTGNGTDLSNYVDLHSSIIEDKSTVGPGKAGKKIQWHVETPVFPTDYSGETDMIKPLSLALEIKVGSATGKLTVPISLKMEKGKRYNFYINVMSEIIEIRYNVSDWDKVNNDNEIGGYTSDYKVMTLDYHPLAGWKDGGGGSDPIGD